MKVVHASTAHVHILAELHGEGFDVPWSASTLLTALASPGAVALIAEDNGEPQGFVLMRSGGGEAEVLTIVTRPGVRRKGVGRLLMDAASEYVREGGAEKLFLEVAADNPAAHALYVALGFSEVGGRKAYYARGDDARVDSLIMARDF